MTKSLGKPIAAIALGALLAFPAVAGAVATLYLDDGLGHSVTVADGSGEDQLAGITGAVSYSGTLGHWMINVSTGTTNPVLGSNFALPSFHLNTDNMSFIPTGTETMTVMFSEGGFQAPGDPAYSFYSAVGGNAAAGAEVSYETYLGSELLELGVPLAAMDFTNPAKSSAGFNGDATKKLSPPNSPFTLTQVVRITQGSGPLVSSLDATLDGSPVPEPATMLLLGSGLLGLAGIGRRRRNQT